MEQLLEKRIENLSDKHDVIQLSLFSNTARIDSLERKTTWMENEIIRGREIISEDFKIVKQKLDLLNDDKVKREGYEQSQKDSEAWKRWILPICVSLASIAIALISLFY